MKYTIGIVGLGLMGASLAMALKGFKDARVIGTDIDEEICRRAQAEGVVDEAYAEPGRVFGQADLVIFCVYARHIPALLQEHAQRLKPGCVVSDICGVKGPLYDEIMPPAAPAETLLPEGIRYVGAHPMAGKERDGYENAEAGLFRDRGFIIVPTRRSTPEGVALMRELAQYIGAGRVAEADAREHDALVAYTSDLTHAAASALCLRPPTGFDPAFAGGGFRDCTRIADINADAWTALLMENSANTADALSLYIEDLQRFHSALVDGDRQALFALLHRAGENKRRMQGL